MVVLELITGFRCFGSENKSQMMGMGWIRIQRVGCVYHTWRICVMLSFRRQVASWQPVLFKNSRLSRSAESNEVLDTNEELIAIAR